MSVEFASVYQPAAKIRGQSQGSCGRAGSFAEGTERLSVLCKEVVLRSFWWVRMTAVSVRMISSQRVLGKWRIDE